MENTANRLRQLRNSIGLSQKEFAATLGIKQTTYNGYETGNHIPKSDVLVAIADKYNVSVDFLLGKADENKKSPGPESSEPRDKYVADFMRCVALLTDDQKDFLLAVLEEYVERNQKSRSAAPEAVGGTVQEFEHHD